jgi:P-type Ca2+ transporter type 2C
MKPFYQLNKEEVFNQLGTTSKGLTSEAAAGLLQKFGPNELQETKQRTKLSILLSQFADVMILILAIAAIISFVVGEHTDAFVILAIIIANAWMGYAQESKAEESIRLLKKMAAQFAVAIRDRRPSKIEASNLVPGDVIMLEAGAIVPADGRLIEAHSLKTDEASLTGESHSIEKTTEPINGDDLVPGDQLNMVFKGTVVSNGSGKAVVVATGMNTELGKIAGLMDVGVQKTPLQKRLATFSKQLAVIVIVICAIIFGFGLWRGQPAFLMFLTALSLAVAALPEALPAVITIALARGANRMVKQKALIRKLPAVETLGSVTYICTDKTGTLTQNVMTVERTEVKEEEKELFTYAMLLNNEVRVSAKNELMGDSTEIALVKHAEKENHSRTQALQDLPFLGKVPFDSARMRMSTLHKYGGKWVLFVKGAPVRIIDVLAEKYKQQLPHLLELNRAWAADGLRVLFFAYKMFDSEPGDIDPSCEKDLEFLGIAAMIDPPREEVINAINECKTAGISTVMITGDQALTAKAIADRLHITSSAAAEVKTGADLDKLNEEEFIKTVRSVCVYARVSPEQKLKIVKALQDNGQFVAMTGDGVNDAPSLKQADIGVSMGITGTDVTKEASDIILLDDNFSTIVKAVREGRRIYENIRKFILYVLSCNLSEILTIFLAPFLGFVTPLLPIHILWINLVTDGLPGVALVSESAEKDIMNRPPRSPRENLFAGGLGRKIILSGVIMTVACLFVLWWAAGKGYSERTQQTMVFTTLCLVQMGNALSVRSVHSVLGAGFFSNLFMWGAILLTLALQLCILYIPLVHDIFKTDYLSLNQWLVIGVVTVVSFFCIECLKLFIRKTP